jgi:4-carboxymuconolactone decarboxylase
VTIWNPPESIASNRPLALSGPIEVCVLSASRVLLKDGDLSDADYQAATLALGEAGITELSTVIGYYSLVALQLRLFGVPG